ncbi:MAG: nucleotidyltransferase family protein, partial [Clostridia bacterium]|nr:nucleotidyltransferase family protein [Clostridia bacterium]
IALRAGACALAFGTQAEPGVLQGIAELSADEDFICGVKAVSSSGKNVSYPAALEKAVAAKLGSAAAEALREPNNILAVEYLKNLRGTGMEPFAIPRAPEYESSGELRAMDDCAKMLSLLPPESAKVFEKAFSEGGRRDIARLDAHFVAFFRTLRAAAAPGGVYGMTPDLAAKLVRESRRAGGFGQLCALCADKKYTLARIRRAVIAAALGYTAAEVKKDPPFTTLLAANANGCALLASLRKTGGIPIITKPADVPREVSAEFAACARASALAKLAAETPEACDTGDTPYIKA